MICFRCDNVATHQLITPEGNPNAFVCKACGQIIIDEYREKLGEIWTLVEDQR